MVERETNGRIGVCRKGVGRWSDDVYPSLQNYNYNVTLDVRTIFINTSFLLNHCHVRILPSKWPL